MMKDTDQPCCRIDYTQSGPSLSRCWMRGLLLSKHYWISAVAAFVAIFFFQWVWHGHLLMDEYTRTEGLWRPDAEMSPGLFTVAQILLALVYAWLVLALTRTPRWIEAVGIGVMIGALNAITCVTYYNIFPFPTVMVPLMWALGYVLEGICAALAIRAVHGWMHKAKASRPS
jgi:hypothetical protein